MRNCQRPVRPSSERERLGRECDPRQRSHPGQRPVRAPCQIHRGTGRPVRRRTARKPLYSRRSTGSFFASRRPADYRRAPLRLCALRHLVLVSSGHPPITGGLHYGGHDFAGALEMAASPRRLPAGSIAACPRWRSPTSPPTLPRRLPAGSIAAPGPVQDRRDQLLVTRRLLAGSIPATRAKRTSSTASPGHAADYRRAPLRPHDPAAGQGRRVPVTPPITGGLHCGELGLFLPIGSRLVIPPITGGLHCGFPKAMTYFEDVALSPRRLPAGSIVAASA
jgi:hypothetical protein